MGWLKAIIRFLIAIALLYPLALLSWILCGIMIWAGYSLTFTNKAINTVIKF